MTYDQNKLRSQLKDLGVTDMGEWVEQVRDPNYLCTKAQYIGYEVMVCYGRHRSTDERSAGVYIGETCVISLTWDFTYWTVVMRFAEWWSGSRREFNSL